MSLLLVMVVVRARIHFVRELIAPALRSHPHPRSPIRPPPPAPSTNPLGNPSAGWLGSSPADP